MLNTEINLQIGIYTGTGKLRFTDLTPYTLLSVPVTLPQILGCLKITSPLAVIYNNANFATPDIDPDNPSIGTYKEVTLPLDSNGNFLSGTYIFEYTVKEYNTTTGAVNYPIASLSQNLKTFVVTGDAHLITGSHFITGSTGNDQGYTVVSATYDGIGTTAIVVNEDIPDTTADGTWYSYKNVVTTYNWDGAGGATARAALKLTEALNYTIPDIKLTLTVDCDASKLTCTDATDYKITVSGAVVDKSSSVKEMTFKYPTTLTTPLADIVKPACNDTEYVTPIYTKVWKVTLETVANYTLSSHASLHLTLIGNDSINVQCNICSCLLYDCEVALKNRYLENLSLNPSEAYRLFSKIQLYYMYKSLWQSAVSCGKTADITTYCNSAKEILVDELCDCSTNTLLTSTLVVPVTGTSVTGTGGSHIYFGSGTPSSSLGVNSDTYYDTTTTKIPIYWKTGGAWVFQGYAQGNASTVPGSDGLDGTTIDHSKLTTAATTATVAEEILDTYTMAGGTLTADGDCVKLTAIYSLASNANDKTVRLYIGASVICEYTVTGVVSSADNIIQMEAYLDKDSANSVLVNYSIIRKGMPGSVPDSPNISTIACGSLATAKTITARAQNGTASANDIVLQKFKAEIYLT